MKVVILSGVSLGAGLDGWPGETHDVIDPLGRSLISRGKAKLLAEAETQAEAKPETAPKKSKKDQEA